jgi:hypothetical protein
MREQRGINANTFKRRASLPPEELEFTASRHSVGSRSGMHPEDRPYITSTHSYHAPTTATYFEIDEEGEEVSTRPTSRTSSRRYDLSPYNREERRTEELPRQGKHPLFYIGICLVIMTLFLTGFVLIPPAMQKWNDDRIYGYPRTFQVDANVGHGDSNFPVSHFIALNLNGRIEVIEMPKGDEGKLQPHLYLIARLAMQGSDLVPVTVSFGDMNGDGKPDMIVTFNGTQWIWFNNGTMFVPKV